MSLTGGWPGAERVEYEPDEWEPGLPLFVRPRSNAQGNHVREMAQLLRIPTEDTCICSDKATWPDPQWHHDLTAPHHLARTEWGGDAA